MYNAAFIPDIFNKGTADILIGSYSLNKSIYDENKGYRDNEAKRIDEEIYAFINDEFFSLSQECFIEKVKQYLD